MLHDFLTEKRAEIIARTETMAAERLAPRATEEQLKRGIPLFFDQLIESLKVDRLQTHTMQASAVQHGKDMMLAGFTVAQVVNGYGDVCQAVTALALELNAEITVSEFHTLNRCLDDATATAVSEYGRLREEALTEHGTQRLGVLAHEMRNRLNTALLSFSILKHGAVSISGSTGAVMERSLKGLSDLIDRALTSVRIDSAIHHRARFAVAGLIEEVEIAAVLEAEAGDHLFTVLPAAPDVFIDADRQLIGAAVANLVQNAFKFTRRRGHVWLRARADAQRVFIDVEDECGGLPPGQLEQLFQPFQQRSDDRSGLGLGLTISRDAVELDGGELGVRDLPGNGCIFTISLPRVDAGKRHTDVAVQRSRQT